MSTSTSRRAPPAKLGTSISAPPRTTRAKRPLSIQSQKSDDPSDFTSLSDSAPSLRRATSPLDASEACVFVLLYLDGKAEDSGAGGEKIWWPARRVPNSTRECKIYGSIGTSKRGALVATDLSQVLPVTKLTGEIRFPHPEYVSSSGPSPRKRQRLDKTALEVAWYDAVSYLVKDMDDTLPSVEFMKSARHIKRPPDANGKVSSSANGKGKGKAKAISISDDELSALSDIDDEPWTPPSADDTLNIPGELVLGKEKKSERQYWYAQIVGYIPPATRGKTPLYKVLWVDGLQGEIERDWFYTCEEDGFGTCTLGKIQSQYVEDEPDEEDSNDDGLFEQMLRDVSPELDAGPLPDGTVFCELDIRDQFVYTKPVLRAILQDAYLPARTTHEMFVAGGRRREAVVKRAGEHGMMNPKDVTLLRRFLEEWVLRGLVQERIKDEDDEGVVVIAEKEMTAPADRRYVQDQAESLRTAANEDEPRIALSPSPPATIVGDPPSSPGPIPPSSSFNSVAPLEVEPPSSPPRAPAVSSLGPASSLASLVEHPPSSVSVDMKVETEPPSSPVAAAAAVLRPPLSFRDRSMDMEIETSDIRTKLEGGDDLSSPPMPPSQLSATGSTKSPRQIGCAAYEMLSTIEKYDYCLNVLLPELLIQIYLWRAGKRPALEVLDEETEEALHDFGAAEKRKRDWVFDGMRLRKKKEEELRLKKNTKVATATAIDESLRAGRSSSRPRRAARR
ncbi:hypothetical protein C8F01DRAFT_1098925 [Mycena amicta]|nr:hypothetical protein C8F01DRAFT_1098925 [Mycena amicta]